MFWSTACAASACAILSSPMPPSRPSGSSYSSSALRSAAACAGFTSRSHQAARTRSNSKWLICICGGPSTPPEPQALAKTRCRSAAPSDGARPPGLALREAARHRTRNPRTSNHSAATRSNLPLFPEKTAVAGFIRRHKLMEFEKSRLAAFSRLQTSARTSLPCANRCFAVAPPCADLREQS
jgi:hypothetical protein